jgi:hypothetical protein
MLEAQPISIKEFDNITKDNQSPLSPTDHG